jgi:anti-anti-sigma factor
MAGPDAKSTVQSRFHGQTLVVVVVPAEIYQSGVVERLGHDVRAAIEAAGDATGVVLDLSGVKFLSSAVLGMLVNTNTRLKSRNMAFAIAGAAGEVEVVLKRTRLNEVIPTYPTAAEAIQGFCTP